MRTLRSKYLSDIPIEEANYRVDFNILEKYQDFSSEILRLSLLGLAIYGFLITEIIFKIISKDTYVFLKPFLDNKNLFVSGAIALLLASLSALAHRYFSTDCLTHFVRRFRLRKKLMELAEKQTQNVSDESKMILEIKVKIENENKSFESDLNKCRWLLIFACSFLVVGVALVIVGFGITLNGEAINLE